MISDFREQHPRALFELRQHGEEGLVAELLNGTADLVLTSDDPGIPAISWQRLLVEPLHLAVPPDHRLAGREEWRLADAAERDVHPPAPRLRAARHHRGTVRGGRVHAPKVGFEGEEVETLRGLVTAGLGVALLPPPQASSTAPHLRVTDVPPNGTSASRGSTGRDLPPLSARFREHILTRR